MSSYHKCDNASASASYALEKKSICRKYILLWKKETTALKSIQDYNEKIALQYAFGRVVKTKFLKWYWFSRSRGRRTRLKLSTLDTWKKSIHCKRYEIGLLSQTRRRLRLMRTRRCIKQWLEAMHMAMILHGYQLHLILQYVKSSSYLCLPPTLIEQNPRLLLISYWKRVRG
jgi:hypothetical protein